MRLSLVAIALAGCFTQTAPKQQQLSNKTPGPAAPVAGFAIRKDGVGPLNRDSPALLLPLRRLLPGYQVKATRDGSLQYDILRDGVRLAYVVPNDDEPTIFNIHVVASTVPVEGYDWRPGHRLTSAAQLQHCECWGNNPTCYKQGEHVAVNLRRECDDLEGAEPAELARLAGETIDRVVWSPTAFGSAGGDDDSP